MDKRKSLKINKKDLRNKRKRLHKKLKSKNLKLKRLLFKTKIRKKNPNNKSLTPPNITKIDQKWLLSSRNPHKPILIPINLTLKSHFLISSKSMKPYAKTENSCKRTLPLREEWPTSELRAKTLSSMTWKVKAKNFKLCAILEATKVFRDSLRFTLNSEEEILLV